MIPLFIRDLQGSFLPQNWSFIGISENENWK